MNPLDLDKLNNERVNDAKLKVAHAIRLAQNPIGCMIEDRLVEDAVKDIAHAVNLVESAHEEMTWACKHFEWDMGVCDEMLKAVRLLGECMSEIIYVEKNAEQDISLAGHIGSDGLAYLSMALAALVRWFDDED